MEQLTPQARHLLFCKVLSGDFGEGATTWHPKSLRTTAYHTSILALTKAKLLEPAGPLDGRRRRSGRP